jgi:protein SCO1
MTTKTILIWACAVLFSITSSSFAKNTASESLPPKDSIYQLQSEFIDQDGRAFKLSQLQGKLQLVAMFYTSCKYICPLIIDSARGIDKALSKAESAHLQVLLISMDSARDTPAVLKAVALKRKLDLARWRLARTDAQSVSKIAALLGVRLRALEDGEFNHTSALVLLDDEGRVLARTEKMGGVPDREFLAAVKAALAAQVKSN